MPIELKILTISGIYPHSKDTKWLAIPLIGDVIHHCDECEMQAICHEQWGNNGKKCPICDKGYVYAKIT